MPDLSPPPIPGDAKTIRDAIECGVSHPVSITGTNPFIVRALVFRQAEHDAARERLERELGDAQRFVSETGEKIPRGARLSFQLRVGAWPVKPPAKTVAWTGKIATVSFEVTPDSIPEGGSIVGECEVHAGALPVATVLFDIPLRARADEAMALTTATLPRSGFISYSSWDLPRVLLVVRGLKEAPIDLFMDVFSLRNGDQWPDELSRHIDQCDVFYLFWSRNAARSKWVDHEWHYALEHKGINIIRPMPLVDPRRVKPPPELGDTLHFDDWIRRYENDARVVGLIRRVQAWMHRG